jgi:L-amino acid N-acyltransferase YncA
MITLRLADSRDIPWIVEQVVLAADEDGVYAPYSPDHWHRDLARLATSAAVPARCELLVIEAGGVGIGYAATRPTPARHGHAGSFEMLMLGISKENQGRHRGREAVRAVVERIRVLDATAVLIGRCSAAASRMKHILASEGFRSLGEDQEGFEVFCLAP